jgi:beta-aspartyl-peptidase (threonine type)
MSKPIAIAIHGGAGTIERHLLSAELEKEYLAALSNALKTGESILNAQGTALDAVEAAVKSLEDCPLFNAGKGAVFTHDKTNELDASIMCGATLNAGSVAAVRQVRNPMGLARAIMEKSNHVMLHGAGAQQFAREQGLELMDDSYFFSQFRYDQLLHVIDEENAYLDHSPEPKFPDDKKFGTVGAVALDTHGNVAAATSTGGMTNKRYGRIGDSPVIGSGTYANNRTCAVSCTGHGEYFLRAVVAYDVSCLMEYKGLSLKDATDFVVHQKLMKLGGEGGLIAVDAAGNIVLPFNSAGMYRGWSNGIERQVAIYKD